MTSDSRELEEAIAARDDARARRDRREVRLANAGQALDDAQREVDDAQRELERLDRIVRDVPRRERILGDPLAFPDADLAAIADGLPAARQAAAEATYELEPARERCAEAVVMRDELRRPHKRSERKLRRAERKLGEADDLVRSVVALLDLRTRRKRVNYVVTGLAVVGLFVGGFRVADWIDNVGERRPWMAIAIAVGFVTVILAALALMRYRDSTDSLINTRGALPALLWVGLFVASPAVRSFDAHQHGALADYCRYGVVSEAQFEGCMRHASRATVARSGSNAARFARGEIEDCRPDAGPFCAQAVAYHGYDAPVRGP